MKVQIKADLAATKKSLTCKAQSNNQILGMICMELLQSGFQITKLTVFDE